MSLLLAAMWDHTTWKQTLQQSLWFESGIKCTSKQCPLNLLGFTFQWKWMALIVPFIPCHCFTGPSFSFSDCLWPLMSTTCAQRGRTNKSPRRRGRGRWKDGEAKSPSLFPLSLCPSASDSIRAFAAAAVCFFLRRGGGSLAPSA